MPGNRHSLITKLASLCGIEREYTDIWGDRHRISPATKLAILEALGLETGSEGSLRHQLRALERKRFLEPVIVIPQRELSKGFPVRLPNRPIPSGFELEISGENEIFWKERFTGEDLRSSREGQMISCQLPLPTHLPLGYYELRVAGIPGGSPGDSSWLIVHPETVYLLEILKRKERIWGLFLPLYALRSERNWGVGDLRDLKELLGWMGRELNAGFVGINPLHSIKNRRPFNLSPYFPSSRIYRNLLYLDVEGVPELSQCPQAQRIVANRDFQGELENLRSSPLVDYERVASLKLRVLELLFRVFPEKGQSPRAEAFARYRRREGRTLKEFATFQALSEEFPDRVWQEWPTGYRDPHSREVKSFQRSRMERILFHQYIQWNIEEQLAEVGREAFTSGMPLGLYADLALGVEGRGAEAWANQKLYTFKAELGAPPDEFFPKGQSWGLPPTILSRLREDCYRPWIQVLRHNLPPEGALRIDHVMGLFHGFWVPSGMTPQDGAYVRGYPEELLGILALESHLHKTLIIGEDLGTVPPWVRAKLAEWGILSSKIFYFERKENGEPIPPERYPEMSLAATNTHDMPTLKGFWQLRDIEWREKLKLYPRVEIAKEERKKREVQKMTILKALEAKGLLPSEDGSEIALLKAIITWLALTPCKLLILNIWDLLGEVEQQNLPGTLEEHPNWCRKLSRELAEIIADSTVTELAHLVNSLREQRK